MKFEWLNLHNRIYKIEFLLLIRIIESIQGNLQNKISKIESVGLNQHNKILKM